MKSRPTPYSISIDSKEGRYTRLNLIPWWDQDRLKRAKVLVVGAGALGNEIIKNLALLGVGNILIIDFDKVEMSNLSRSILFRESDEGETKAHSAVATVRDMNPDTKAYALNADITWQVGLGIFRWADVVLGGLDNREARLAVNRSCWKVNRPWVDGATESFQGIARVFVPPNGVCYECTLSEQDFRYMEARNSCGFIAREAYRRGSVPTTPTTSAVIAGIQVQEAIKLLHPEVNLPVLSGKGFFFDGTTYDCFTIQYIRNEDCLSHETYYNIITSPLHSKKNTIADVINIARDLSGGNPIVELPCEMVVELCCGQCGSKREFFRLLDAVTNDDARCEHCGHTMVPEVVSECDINSPFANIPIGQLGFGIMEILKLRTGSKEVYIEVSADKHSVLGGQV